MVGSNSVVGSSVVVVVVDVVMTVVVVGFGVDAGLLWRSRVSFCWRFYYYWRLGWVADTNVFVYL